MMMETHYLRWPQVVPDTVIDCICTDLEREFAAMVEGKLELWRKCGITDPYELAQRRQDLLNERLPNAQKLLDKYVESIPSYLVQNEVSDDEFTQAWALMGSIWNTVQFERIRPVVRLQLEYPVLLTVASVLGRVADDEGGQRMRVGSGTTMGIHHSAPSDIEGITVGNDLSALLPGELAQMTDSDLDGLFAYKFATRRLQTFQYKSLIAGPQRKVQIRKARQKGPMIVCLDTSGSMVGGPIRVAQSLIIKLLQLALKQNRDLMLIAFDVKAKPFDVRRNRARLLDFFRNAADANHGTDATEMLHATLSLVVSSPLYMNADVLWVSDFKFPLVEASLLREMRDVRDEGTRFYGLQVGNGVSTSWGRYFDRIWPLELHKTAVKHYNKKDIYR